MRFLLLILMSVLTPSVSVSAASMLPIIANADFEQVQPGNDAPGWSWGVFGGASVSLRSDDTNPHSGKRCLEFDSSITLTPHVYSRLNQGVAVMPGTKYELGAWVRAEETTPGTHFTDWSSYTMEIPPGSYGWRKVAFVFSTRNDQSSLNLGFNIGNKCKKLALDDITLRPIGTPLEGEGIEGSYIAQGRVDGDNRKTPLGIFVTSSLDKPATVQALVKAGSEVLFTKSETIDAGDTNIEWEWNSGSVLARKLDLTIRVTDSSGKVIASGSQEIEKLTQAILLADIDKVEKRLKGEFTDLYKQCKAKGIPVDYPMATKTMLEQFIPLEREDAQKNEERRANFAIKDFNRALDESTASMKFYLKNPKLAPNAKRYKTGNVEIKGLSFIADRIDSRGKKDRGPVFFNGFGHFVQCQKDIPLWPGYGVNIIQIEIGPSMIFPTEDKVDLAAVNAVVKTLDDAAKHNSMVCVLLSPHYFPGWALDKSPHLRKGGGGFLGYVVDEKEAKQLIEKYLRAVVPIMKDHPALHSFCLSNEPVFDRTTGADNTRPMWNAYLARTHKDIDTLNACLDTSYKSFDEVPVGGGFDDPQYYDYCMFNKERFAGWHEWMADVIHEMTPKTPVHAKLCMVLELPSRSNSHWGVDPELFGQFSQINGNDSYIGISEGFWNISWHFQNMLYDLQRSLAKKPIFNTENHPTADRSTNYVPPEHFRTALWQGAIHGQGATTIWLWERTFDRGYDFYGNVMDRPGCALATGLTNLDLNRLAEEVTALQNVKSPVAILYSKASFMRDGTYIDTMNRTYEALNFCGVKVDFISDQQLAAGKGSEYKMIVLTQATRLPLDTLKAICNLPAKTSLVTVGDTPQKDPYNKDLPADGVKQIRDRTLAVDGKLASDKIWPILHGELKKLGGLPDYSIVDAKTGKPVWGVEWLAVKLGSRNVINIVNLTGKPVEVKIVSGGKEVKAKNLLSLGRIGEVRLLKPITPVLAEIKL